MASKKKWYVLYRVNNGYHSKYVEAVTVDEAYRKANCSDIVAIKMGTYNRRLAEERSSMFYYMGREWK